MKRRDALKTMGALAGATAGTRLLGACGDNGLPPGIEHVVVVMMENRSYDHLLGARALEGLGGDGLTPAMTNAGRDGTLYVLKWSPANTGRLIAYKPGAAPVVRYEGLQMNDIYGDREHAQEYRQPTPPTPAITVEVED